MKAGTYFITLLAGVACVVLTIALMLTAQANQTMQIALQEQQQKLNNSVLSPQGQQISNSVIKDINDAAAANAELRKLLQKYNIPTQQLPRTPAAAALEDAAAETGAVKPPAAPVASTNAPAPLITAELPKVTTTNAPASP